METNMKKKHSEIFSFGIIILVLKDPAVLDTLLVTNTLSLPWKEKLS
jgi:hypothetical protein